MYFLEVFEIFATFSNQYLFIHSFIKYMIQLLDSVD